MSKKSMKSIPVYQIFGLNSKRVKFKGMTFNSYEAARKHAVRWLRKKLGKTSFYPAIGIDGGMRVDRVA